MSDNELQQEIVKIIAKGRITFGDVQRLQRDVLPDGLVSRAEAEALLALDRQVEAADRAWADWLAATIVDFAVWAERPTGRVEGDAAAWLTAALAAGGAPTRAGRLIAREVAREAERVDEAVIALALDAPQALVAA